MTPEKILRMAFSISLLILSSSMASRHALTYGYAAQSDQEARPLEQGKIVEREISAGEAHTYLLSLAAGKFLRVVIEQQSISAVMTLAGPDGKNLVEVDSSGSEGKEIPLLAITESAGDYRLEVRASAKDAAPARYKLSIKDLREATEQDRSRVAAEWALHEGRRLRQQGTALSLRKALEKYQKALPLYRAVGDRGGEVAVLSHIGEIHSLISDYKKAIDYFNQALPIYRDLGERVGEAKTLFNIGVACQSLGDNQKAIDYYNQSLALARAAGDRVGEATILNYIGIVYRSLDDNQKAIEYYNQSLALVRAVGHRTVEPQVLSNLGGAYAAINDNQKAIEYYNQALPLARSIGDRAGEATVLNNIGTRYISLSEYRKALEYYDRALALYRAAGFRRGEAAALGNIGNLYTSLGETQKALEYFDQSLSLVRAIGERQGEATVLNNIGGVYSTLNEHQKARDFYTQALTLFRSTSSRRGEATALNRIGETHYVSGENQQALEYYNQSLAIFRAINYRLGEANSLNHIGRVYQSLNEKQKALDYFTQALSAFQSIANRGGQASALNHIGEVYSSQGDHLRALDHLNQSLAIRRAIGERNGEASTLYNIARAYRDQGDLVRSRSQSEAALLIVETQRSKVASPESRASYFASVRKLYDLEIDLLMQLHRQDPSQRLDSLALETSERARARSLLELLAEARADIRQGVDQTLLERERLLGELIGAKAERQTQLLGGKHTAEQASAAAKELESLLTEYQQVQAQIRSTSPRYAALTQPQPISLADIQQQVLDRDTLLLEYALGEERSYLWAISSSSITSHQLPKRADIEAAARPFYELLRRSGDAEERRGDAATGGRGELEEAAHQLSRMLLSPVADRLGSKRLVVVADGVLNYIPFAALPSPVVSGQQSVVSGRRGSGKSWPLATGYRPLIEDHEIVNLPSASVLAQMRREIEGRKPAAKAVAVFADPVFSRDDPRLKMAGTPSPKDSHPQARDMERAMRDVGLGSAGFPRLPFSRREAEAITAAAPRGQTAKALDFEASRVTATSEELSKYRIIHFATHGLLDSQYPELSGIVLSLVDREGQPQNGFLRLHEVYNLRLPAELVVLSACQTGLGKEIRGEGLVGLTRGFMYAGAARVVASLWKVDDAATADLMKRFYRKLLGGRLSPAASLREAQIEMWKQERWRSPYYWAAFVVQGEWR